MDRVTRMRLANERQEVSYRYRALTEYITKDERYEKLSETEKELLQKQHRILGEYQDVIDERLGLPDA